MLFFWQVLYIVALGATQETGIPPAQEPERPKPKTACERCTERKLTWFMAVFFNSNFTKCIPKDSAESWTQDFPGAEATTDCTKLSNDQNKISDLEITETVPKECDTCLEDRTHGELKWCITTKEGRTFRGCLPAGAAENLCSPRGQLVPADGRYRQQYDTCNDVPEKRRIESIPKLLPLDLGTCAECTNNRRFKWCITEVSGTVISFCTLGRCPGGIAHTRCSRMIPEEELQKQVVLEATCTECSTDENEDEMLWCVQSFYGKKTRYCIPTSLSKQLCPNGRLKRDCSEFHISDQDPVVPEHESETRTKSLANIIRSPLLVIVVIGTHLII